MQQTDREAFSGLLTNVMAYYGRDTSTFLLDVFWTGLSAHDYEDVQRAFDLHARNPDNGQFPPKLADITKLLEGSTQTQGMRAWAKVERAVRSVGAYRSVVFDDPLIHVVLIEMGGWTPLCRCEASDMPFKAREFERRYASYRLRRELPAFPPRLMGESESQNRLNGRVAYEVKPVLVGDQDRALKVLERGADVGALRITDMRLATSNALATITHQEGVSHDAAA
ncbi:DUF6475 domain-containing protein [Dyella kyungheensis]|uniref:DUF6475 domain-containing protein n=1 Tax=Dyella kyungheensis TaxID=1242174 RepID=UPI003CEAA7BC